MENFILAIGTIEDNDVGFDKEIGHGYGLLGMKERINALDGNAKSKARLRRASLSRLVFH